MIELLVVISIIGILAGIILVGLNLARDRARDARVKEELGNMRAAMEIYYLTNKTYYIDSDNRACVDPDVVKITDSLSSIAPNSGCQENTDNGSSWIGIAQLPSDDQPILIADPDGGGGIVVNPDADVWCVDNSGFSGRVSGADMMQVLTLKACRVN